MYAFVIAFISCTGGACQISYPLPDRSFASYRECQVRLPPRLSATGFDAERFEGAEIACVQVPRDFAANEGVMVEPTNLRDAPSADADVVAVIARGTRFEILGRERKWLRVRLADGRQGYLWSERAASIESAAGPSDRVALQQQRPAKPAQHAK